MENQLYIPKRIKVGYQKRDDTYSKKLAYIVYWDDKGKLRKETSWEGWRDKKIDAEEYDNVPTSGFILHKDIKRYNWGNFSSKRTMIRVFDPRGIEFEITTENLIGVLMNTDCSKRALVGDFVYAWSGPELVLLPTNAEEYEKANEYTVLQAGKVGVKDLVPGCIYRTKKQVDYIYVGRYPWHEWSGRVYYAGETATRDMEKRHIFTPVKTKKKSPYGDYEYDAPKWETKTSLSSFASRVTQESVDTFADIIEDFKKEPHSGAVIKWEVKPCELNLKPRSDHGGETYLERSTYFRQEGNLIVEYKITRVVEGRYTNGAYRYDLLGYDIEAFSEIDLNTGKITKKGSLARDSYYNYNQRPKMGISAEVLYAKNLCDLYVTYENGDCRKIDSLTSA